MKDYKFKSPPFKHQEEVLGMSWDREYFALLMEQGTGKSKVLVDNAAYLYLQKKIECFIVVAPNGVHRKWMREDIPFSLPDEIKFKSAIWQSGSATALKAYDKLFEPGDFLRILVINVESFSGSTAKTSKRIPKGYTAVKALLQKYKTFLAVDESSYIKNHSASRTENICKLGDLAAYRRIASGTSASDSPLDLFGQMSYLSDTILGRSFYSFKANYSELLPAGSPTVIAIMRSNPNVRVPPQIVATDPVTGAPRYRNLDKLRSLIAPHSYRKLKTECFDLPEKLYRSRYFEMEKNQRKMYDSLRATQKAEFQGEQTTIVQKLTLIMRLSQLVRGYMLDADDNLVRLFEPKDNPAIQEMLACFEEVPTQAIIWCRFKHEIQDAMTVLGDKAVPYYGDIKANDREANLARFRRGDAQYLVGTVDAGGIGLNMYEAPYTFFYSNQFSSGKRLQAEDRNHRYGSVGIELPGSTGSKVLYEDLVCPDSVDEKVLTILKSKKEVADYIMDFSTIFD